MPPLLLLMVVLLMNKEYADLLEINKELNNTTDEIIKNIEKLIDENF